MTENDQAAIAELPAQLVQAWAAHDADAFADLFHDDGAMLLPGVYADGRENIRSHMAKAYAAEYADTEVTGSPIGMKSLGDQAAVLLTTGGVYQSGGSLQPEDEIRASWVVTKRDDQWRLSVYQNCPAN